ncbi:MAG: sodium:proton antiporter, partial [Deltaproteobacteria bacterium]|nr:sodium:proton antiporter [Deltaproteobacteria bacterium]
AGDAAHAVAESAKLKLAALPMMGWQAMVGHVAALTVLSNLGKMLPAFVYRDEAHWRERLALAIGMWPRGEVGAGILIVSLGYGMGGTILAVCVLVLALNLTLTGPFIWIVKKLVAGVPRTA